MHNSLRLSPRNFLVHLKQATFNAVSHARGNRFIKPVASNANRAHILPLLKRREADCRRIAATNAIKLEFCLVEIHESGLKHIGLVRNFFRCNSSIYFQHQK